MFLEYEKFMYLSIIKVDFIMSLLCIVTFNVKSNPLGVKIFDIFGAAKIRNYHFTIAKISTSCNTLSRKCSYYRSAELYKIKRDFHGIHPITMNLYRVIGSNNLLFKFSLWNFWKTAITENSLVTYTWRTCTNRFLGINFSCGYHLS